MKLYASNGKQLSWVTFWLFAMVLYLAWIVLGGIPAAIAAVIWGAEGATAVWGTWLIGVSVMLIVSLVRGVKSAIHNNEKFGEK